MVVLPNEICNVAGYKKCRMVGTVSHREHRPNLKTFKFKLIRNPLYFPNKRWRQAEFGLMVLRVWLSLTWLVIDSVYERNKLANSNILQQSRAFWLFFLIAVTNIHTWRDG